MSVNSETPNSAKKNVTVKIQIPETENTLAHSYSMSMKIEELIEDIAKKFKVESKFLKIFQFQDEILNNKSLAQLIFNEFGIIEISVQLSEEALDNNITLDTNVYYR
jgi:hypothetical protein